MSLRSTSREREREESILTVHTFVTSARDIMFATEASLYHTSPRLGKSPTMLESWKPLFVIALRTCGLRRILRNIFLFLNTEIVHWESSKIHVGSMVASSAWAITTAYWTNVVPLVTTALPPAVGVGGTSTEKFP